VGIVWKEQAVPRPADATSAFILVLLGAWELIKLLGIYVVAGAALAALADVVLPKDRPAKLLASDRWWIHTVAALLGMASPACTYGTVPIFVEMVKRGGTLSVAATFLVASSLVNPQMLVLAAGAFGFKLAAAQTAFAFIVALAAGGAVKTALRAGFRIENAELLKVRRTGDDPDLAAAPATPRRHAHNRRPNSRLRAFLARFVDILEFIGLYFIFGAILASAINIVLRVYGVSAIPLLSRGKWYAVPAAAVLSLPVYVCGGGTIPLLAEASRYGMDKGAVLAFLIAGPATRLTPLAGLAILFRKRAIAVYVVGTVLLATGFGVLFGRFF